MLQAVSAQRSAELSELHEELLLFQSELTKLVRTSLEKDTKLETQASQISALRRNVDRLESMVAAERANHQHIQIALHEHVASLQHSSDMSKYLATLQAELKESSELALELNDELEILRKEVTERDSHVVCVRKDMDNLQVDLEAKHRDKIAELSRSHVRQVEALSFEHSKAAKQQGALHGTLAGEATELRTSLKQVTDKLADAEAALALARTELKERLEAQRNLVSVAESAEALRRVEEQWQACKRQLQVAHALNQQKDITLEALKAELTQLASVEVDASAAGKQAGSQQVEQELKSLLAKQAAQVLELSEKAQGLSDELVVAR